MCLIIDKPAGARLKEDDVLSAIEVNPDGFGWMYSDPSKNRVYHGKSLDFKKEQIVEYVTRRFDNRRVMFHLRYQTQGEISKANCHPFKLMDHRVDGMDAFMMHNGTIYKHKPKDKNDTHSDSELFGREILRPLLVKFGADALSSDILNGLIEEYLGTNNKVSVMLSNGTVHHFNKDKGDEREGCWVSNTYSFNSNHRKPAATSTNYGYNRNMSGVSKNHTVPYSKEFHETHTWDKDKKEYVLKKVEGKDQVEKPITPSTTSGGGSKTENSVVPLDPSKSLDKMKQSYAEEMEDFCASEDQSAGSTTKEPPTDTYDLEAQVEYFLENKVYMQYDEVSEWCWTYPDAAAVVIYEYL